jgi:hypothetical protein
MIRNLKALGLALVAVFAINAIAGSAASAQQGKLTSEGPMTLNAMETGAVGSGANALTGFSGKIECPASLYTGHKYNVTPHELLSSGATEVTVTPHYINCFSESSGGLFSATVDMNGCDYVFHIGETTGENTYGVTADMVCPESENIRVTLLLTPTHETKVCTLTIKPQTGLSGVHLTTNPATDDLSMVGTLKKIHLEKSGLCGASTTTEGALAIDVKIKGKNEAGKATGITVTD